MKGMTRCWWIALLAGWLATGAGAQKIVELEVRGELRKVSESLILSTISLRPGLELSMENVQQAVRDLQGLRVFSDIQIYREAVPGGVKLILVLDELPTLQGIRFKGNKQLKEKEMRDALGLVNGQVIAPWDVTRGVQKITDLYREKGYLRVQVDGRLFDGDEQGRVFLQYEIDEGEKVKIRQINLELLHQDGTQSTRLEPLYDHRRPGSVPPEVPGLTVREVKSQMETKEKRWWRKGEYNQDTFLADQERILAHYRRQGHQQAVVLRDSVYYDESRKDLFIDLVIEEGRQYRLGEVEWVGNELFTAQELAARLSLHKGRVYRFSGLELADMVRMAYYEKGYLDTRVLPDEQVREESVDVRFQIFEGQLWTLRHIRIAGNTKTREKVIRREIELRPGDVYQQKLLQDSQRRIYMLNFFKDVQIHPEYSPLDDQHYVDLTFMVEERPTGQASMGAGYSDRDRLVGQIGLQIPNFRGLGQQLDFSWEFGQRREQFLVGFTEPWLFDTPTTLAARVYTLNQKYFDYYDYQRNAISMRVGRRLKKPAYSSLSLGYRLEKSDYTNFSESYTELQQESRYQPRTTSTFDMTYQRDARNFPQFPSQGTLFYYKPELATSLVAGDVDFHRHELRFNYYRPSWWKFVLSVETKVAAIDGFTDYDNANIPFWERFTPGGIDLWDGQVRGYPDQSLGPRLSGIPIGGNSMMVINMEYRFPLAEQQVYGLLFADAGNSWEGVKDLNPLQLRRSAGFGFRLVTPMLGTIGFDFGYGFDRRKVDGQPAGWSTHFQFGPQFF